MFPLCGLAASLHFSNTKQQQWHSEHQLHQSIFHADVCS